MKSTTTPAGSFRVSRAVSNFIPFSNSADSVASRLENLSRKYDKLLDSIENGKPGSNVKPAAKERIVNVTKNNTDWFASFGNLPTAAPFQAFFNDAGERGQQAVKRSQKAIEELAEVSKANVEALVEAGKVAVEGAKSLGQDVVETSREGVEKAADAVRALAEAKSPTEFMQLQTEFARAQFDRFVAESSRLTETFVKLAGEAIQPIQTRATLNAEKINKLVA